MPTTETHSPPLDMCANVRTYERTEPSDQKLRRRASVWKDAWAAVRCCFRNIGESALNPRKWHRPAIKRLPTIPSHLPPLELPYVERARKPVHFPIIPTSGLQVSVNLCVQKETPMSRRRKHQTWHRNLRLHHRRPGQSSAWSQRRFVCRACF